jgi:hypothetical protein
MNLLNLPAGSASLPVLPVEVHDTGLAGFDGFSAPPGGSDG